jgi:hypothetical protein
MKPKRSSRDTFLPALAVVAGCVWLSGCGGLTPLSEITGETETGRPAPEETPAPTPVDGGRNSGGGSDSGGGGNDGGSDGDDGDGMETVVYTWSLPPDPETPTVNDDSAYEALFQGDCDRAESLIPRATDVSPNFGSWTGPRAIVFTAAGLAFCRGDFAAGRSLTLQGIDEYGVGGLGPEDMLWCKLYRELRSVIEQRPEDAFECRGHYLTDKPVFKTGVDANGDTVWDDPLTPEDETVQPPPFEPPPASESPDRTPAAPGTPSEGDIEEGRRGE